jgi:sigma54-dependent transcription regulator
LQGNHSSNRKTRARNWVIGALVAMALGYLVLLVPESGSTPRGAGKQPFVWKQDAFWAELENRFNQARAAGCQNLHSRMATASSEIQAMLDQISNHSLPPEAPVFTNLETGL